MDGTIPTELFSASNLTTLLLLETEGLAGSIPTEIGKATNLEALDFAQNRLLGSLPKELFDLTLLRYLDLYLNSFAGEIPKEIGNLSRLDCMCNSATVCVCFRSVSKCPQILNSH